MKYHLIFFEIVSSLPLPLPPMGTLWGPQSSNSLVPWGGGGIWGCKRSKCRSFLKSSILKTEELTYHLIFCEIVLRPPASTSVGDPLGALALTFGGALGGRVLGYSIRTQIKPLAKISTFLDHFLYRRIDISFDNLWNSTQPPYPPPIHVGTLWGALPQRCPWGRRYLGYPRSKWRSFLKSSILKTPIDIFCDIVLSPLFRAPFRGPRPHLRWRPWGKDLRVP